MEAAEVSSVVRKVAEQLLADDDEDDKDDGNNHAGITEESVAEVMRWLELEIKLAAGAAVLALPSPSARFVAASQRVSGESCGPAALSGPAETVMAAVDGRPNALGPPAVPWPWPEPAEAAAEMEPEDDDEGAVEWAMQMLTDGPEAEMLCSTQ